MTGDSFKKSVPNEYREIFDIADEVMVCIEQMLEKFNQKGLKLFDLSACRRIFLFILTRSMKTYASILALCRLGYGQDVATLLRGLLENLITTKYILADPAEADCLTRRFVAYKWIIFKRSLQEQEKGIKDTSLEKRREFYQRKDLILKQVANFKKEFGVTSDRALITWSGKTARDMAKHVGHDLLAEYDETFRQCSRFSHPSILGDQEYMVQDDRNLVFSPLPSSIGVVLNLNQAVKYFLDFAVLTDEQFELGGNDCIEALRHRHSQFVKQYINPEIAPSSQTEKPVPIRECSVVFKLNE